MCCSDHVHCCPQGTKCDIQQKKCIGRGVNLGTITMEMIEVKDNSSPQQPLQGFPLTALKENTVCPDGQSECKTGQTCCKLASGMYGCCPLPKVGRAYKFGLLLFLLPSLVDIFSLNKKNMNMFHVCFCKCSLPCAVSVIFVPFCSNSIMVFSQFCSKCVIFHLFFTQYWPGIFPLYYNYFDISPILFYNHTLN